MLRFGFRSVDDRDQAAFGHGVIQPHFHGHEGSGHRRRHFHGGLVAFQGDQRILRGYAIAHRHPHHVDHVMGLGTGQLGPVAVDRRGDEVASRH